MTLTLEVHPNTTLTSAEIDRLKTLFIEHFWADFLRAAEFVKATGPKTVSEDPTSLGLGALVEMVKMQPIPPEMNPSLLTMTFLERRTTQAPLPFPDRRRRKLPLGSLAESAFAHA